MARINRNLLADRLVAATASVLIWAFRRLPYQLRRRAAATLGRLAVSRLPALRRRVTGNLDLAWPELDAAGRKKLVADVGHNFGLTLAEMYSAPDLKRLKDDIRLGGPGLAALEKARARGKGAVLVSGHFGSWEAVRIALQARGIEVGAVYRPNNNRYYDPGFLRAIRQFGEPVLPNTPAGTKALIRHVGKGGTIALLIDQHIAQMPLLTFFGQPARTATFAAELALRHDLPLIPVYGIRHGNGTMVDAVFETPVAHSEAMAMTQALNDSLEARVRADPGQWHWLHHRWRRPKPPSAPS